MWTAKVFEPPFVEVIDRVQADMNAFFGSQGCGALPPRFAPLPLLADEIKMRREHALKSSAATFSLHCLVHHRHVKPRVGDRVSG